MVSTQIGYLLKIDNLGNDLFLPAVSAKDLHMAWGGSFNIIPITHCKYASDCTNRAINIKMWDAWLWWAHLS